MKKELVICIIIFISICIRKYNNSKIYKAISSKSIWRVRRIKEKYKNGNG